MAKSGVTTLVIGEENPPITTLALGEENPPITIAGPDSRVECSDKQFQSHRWYRPRR